MATRNRRPYGMFPQRPINAMLLIIPSLSIREGRCTYAIEQAPAFLLTDPVQMAKLWRVQNAKTLVLEDLPSARPNTASILEVCGSVDIPVQVDCSQAPDTDHRRYLDCGVYRLILGTSVDPGVFAELVEKFGRSRLALRIDDSEPDLVTTYSAAGCCRFIVDVTDSPGGGLSQLLAVTEPERLAGRPGRFTARGFVSDYNTLRTLVDRAPGVLDSVIVGTPLYEQAFPCQATWCWNQLSWVDLDCFSTASERLPSGSEDTASRPPH